MNDIVMDKAQNEIFSAIIKVLKDNNLSPIDGIECVVNVTADFIGAAGAVMHVLETDEEKDGFVKDILQQVIDQLN